MGTVAAGAFLGSPAFACRGPAAKDRAAYARAIERLFMAWWARDVAAFEQLFHDPDRNGQIDVRRLFDAHFAKAEQRFQGEMLFNGNAVVVQILTPKEADPVRGICGGYAIGDLFLVRLFPGLAGSVVDEVRHIETNILAEEEWKAMKRYS